MLYLPLSAMYRNGPVDSRLCRSLLIWRFWFEILVWESLCCCLYIGVRLWFRTSLPGSTCDISKYKQWNSSLWKYPSNTDQAGNCVHFHWGVESGGFNILKVLVWGSDLSGNVVELLDWYGHCRILYLYFWQIIMYSNLTFLLCISYPIVSNQSTEYVTLKEQFWCSLFTVPVNIFSSVYKGKRETIWVERGISSNCHVSSNNLAPLLYLPWKYN